MKMTGLLVATLALLTLTLIACNPGADPKMVAEVSQALSFALQEPVPKEVIGVEPTLGGTAIRIRVRVAGEETLRQQADGACRSKLTRLINIGGAVLFVGEDAAGRRIGEVSVDKDYCAPVVAKQQRPVPISQVRTATIFFIPPWFSSRVIGASDVRKQAWVRTEILSKHLTQSLLKWLTSGNFVAPPNDNNPLIDLRLVIDFALEDGSIESYHADRRTLLEVKSGWVREIDNDFWFYLGPTINKPYTEDRVPLSW
jgi:hypothetical protein